MGKNPFATVLLAILLTSLALPTVAGTAQASSTSTVVEEQGQWKKLQTDVITVLFPTDGRKPMFLWWYNQEPGRVYVVKYQGLYEFFALEAPLYYYRHTHLAEWYRLREWYIGEGWFRLRWQLREALRNIYDNWHLPYLPFSAGIWTLTEVKDITAGDDVIGVAFAFKLVDLPLTPRFEFAENNIMIRNRFYFVPVTEVVDGHEYNVSAGEMKMDLVINNWKWNLDTLKPLLSELRDLGIGIPEGRTGLALWINLASINVTSITPYQAENVETISTTSEMEIDDTPVPVVQNQTGDIEKPITAPRRFFAHYRIRFTKAKNDTTLTGFFKFVSQAKAGDRLVNVTAAYIEAGYHMRLFIGYPYFGSETLVHDPSLGLEVPETMTPEATTPVYKVEAPSGINQIMPRVLLPLTTLQIAIILAGAVSIIAAIIFVAKWKRKIINVVR